VAAGKEFRYELHNRREYKSVYTSATHDNFKRKSDYLCAFLVLLKQRGKVPRKCESSMAGVSGVSAAYRIKYPVTPGKKNAS
jgi:hypothetical protein